MNKQDTVLYHNEGEACSYPYRFQVTMKDGARWCTSIHQVYRRLQILPDEREGLIQKLQALPVGRGCAYELTAKNDILYRAEQPYDESGDDLDNEVSTRRHFIEDFIETEEDLKAAVDPFHGETCKTEFVTEEVEE